MTMRVAFRADASLQIGTGHVIRCLTLADALKASGAQCRFICRKHPGNLLEMIRQRGYEAHALPVESGRVELVDSTRATHAAWLGTDWATDAGQARAALWEARAEWVIVDHYALDASWERALRPACRRLMVIDDLADRPHDCDLLLDQNLRRKPSDYVRLVPETCTILAGPCYTLLRPEFAAIRNNSLRRRAKPQLKRLLITMGGVDQSDATSLILMALKDCSLPADCLITVVMGPYAPWLERVRLHASQMPWATVVLMNVRDMAKLMAESDLAIGASGGTSWERCCLGLPTIMMVLADNQRESAAALHEVGGAVLLDTDVPVSVALKSALRMLEDLEKMSAMSQASSRITDGQGVDRVMSTLFEYRG